MFDRETLILTGLAVALAAYLLFVNRRCQVYAGRAVFDATPQEVYDLIDLRPETPPWVPGLTSVEPADEDADDFWVNTAAGHRMRSRVWSADPPWRVEASVRYLWRGQRDYGDTVHGRYQLAEEDGRTVLTSECVVERGPLFNGFLRRLSYPFMNATFARMAGQELANRSGTVAKQGPAPATAKRGLIQAGLALGTIAWLVSDLGWSVGLVILATLVVHEYGHLWAMRRHGHAARVYLLPFFGGVAVGSKPFGSDAEGAEIVLMGPVFGCLPGLACLVGFALTDDLWFAAAGGLSLFVNGLNLAPAPPLDGGRVAQILLRPLGDRAWFAGSGLLLLGGAAAAYATLRSPLVMVVFVLGAVAWSLAPTPPAAVRPLGRGGLLAASGAYLGLSVLHVAVLAHVLDVAPWDDLVDALAFGPDFLA